MISAQTAKVTGLTMTALIDVCTAQAAPQSRSRSKGNEITPTLNTAAAKTKPRACPRMMSIHPRPVVRTSFRKATYDRGAKGP